MSEDAMDMGGGGERVGGGVQDGRWDEVFLNLNVSCMFRECFVNLKDYNDQELYILT